MSKSARIRLQWTLGVLMAAGLAVVSPAITAQQQQAPAANQTPEVGPQPAAAINNEAINSTNPFNTAGCINCHNGAAGQTAPTVLAMRQKTPQQIYRAITTGSMQQHAAKLTDEEKKLIAESVTGRRMGSIEDTSAASMPNRCTSIPPLTDASAEGSWNGWSPSMSNTRLQPASVAKLSPGQIARMRLKWAFGIPNASSMYNQPTVVSGRVYVSSDTGQVYSLDAASGCVYWSFQALAGVRSAITLGPKPGSQQQVAYFGDVHAGVYAVDASNGELLWKAVADKHPEARIIAAPRLFRGRLYVPVAALEEVVGGSATYACCSTRGAVTAIDAATGKVIWETYTIQETPFVTGKNSRGNDVWGPSGASVWNSPTIDAKRNALYVGTGNGFTDPPTKYSDAIMAMDLETGKVLWSVQTHPHDIWHGGCIQAVPGRNPNARGVAPGRDYPPESCPQKAGPDWDYSASMMLTTLTDGRQLLLAPQKSGTVYALDLDKKGAIVWSADVARVLPGGGGEIVFGGAADDRTAYFNLRSGGLVALDLATGMEKWFTSMTPRAGSTATRVGLSSAVTLIPGVVLSGGLDGMMRAYLASSGDLIWQFDTAQDFKTVNNVEAKGGSIGMAGPVVVDGSIYVVSGYIGFQRGMPGNVVLGFSTGE